MNRLENIKNAVEAMDGNLTLQLFGYEMNGDAIVDDFKWLIEQAEASRKVELVLASSELEDDAKLNNIISFYYNE